MAIYNTASDASNTSVRALLTKIGELYYGRSYNTGSGAGKKVWLEIRDQIFNGCCVYCGEGDVKLTIEHLIMFNRTEFGLHHPGNTVPCCSECNKRRKGNDKRYLDWKSHLRVVCEERGEPDMYEPRLNKVVEHMERGPYTYPKLTHEELSAIKVISQSLYENIKIEVQKSLNLYSDLDKEFLGNN